MNIDQFISKLETSDAYRNNGRVKKLVSESRQALVDLASGGDRDAFMAEFVKFKDRLDECLNKGAAEARKAEIFEELGFYKQYNEHLKTLMEFGLYGGREGEALPPLFTEIIETFTLEQLELATTFQEPTLLLVPENSFESKVKAMDNHKIIEWQHNVFLDDVFSKGDSSSEKITGWKAIIVEGAEEMGPKEGDDEKTELPDRVKNRKAMRRPGEKGMDRHAYSMLMMESIENRKPIDMKTVTPLDDDFASTDSKTLQAHWYDGAGRVHFVKDSLAIINGPVRFRSSVGGDVVLNAVLTPDQKKVLDSLEVPEGVDLAEVKKALKARPALLESLTKMTNTGGKPRIIEVQEDAYIFADCSESSPLGRRYQDYAGAEEMAKKFGVEMMNIGMYGELSGKYKFTEKTGDWIRTPDENRSEGMALSTSPMNGKAGLILVSDKTTSNLRGWRGVLRVPKVS